MYIIKVLLEHGVTALDRTFDYCFTKPIFRGIRVKVLFNKKELIGYVMGYEEIESLPLYEEQVGFPIQPIVEIIDEQPLLNDELDQLAHQLAKETFAPLIRCYQTLLPSSLKPSSGNKVKIKTKAYVRIVEPRNEEGLTPRQKEIYQQIDRAKEIAKSEISSASILKLLEQLHRVETFQKEIFRDPYAIEVSRKTGPALSRQQTQVLQEFKESQDFIYLLQGVTGSGKTEVYIHLCEDYLAQGKSVLMLVPEIALTPMMITRFKERIPEEIAIIHSGLSSGQRYDEYRKILQKNIRLVIGVRSAVFAPITNIGLIIMDEEHSESYKQESTPSYHARDVAVYRAQYYGAKVLLGSATPSLESQARALKGVYHLLKLTERINQKGLPKVKIVNMVEELKKGNYSLFSQTLAEEITERLAKKEQIMLLLNRRGYAHYVECKHCHTIMKCPNCEITLTYHKKEHALKCHYCNYQMPYPDSCPTCHKQGFKQVGSGTQKMEEQIQEQFPGAKVGRMDLDSIGKTKNYNEILTAFEDKKYDILLGTQMIAKGLDFENVTLVGVLNADLGLHDFNFRSQEQTFQLLTQVVGRSGRGNKEGTAIIQTNNPTNPAIVYASKHDYEQFFLHEMEFRKSRKYPPYRYLIQLMFVSKQLDDVANFAEKMKQWILSYQLNDVSVLGPTQPYISKVVNGYRMKLLIKYKEKEKISPLIEEIQNMVKLNWRIGISVNVDPMTEE